MTPRSGRVGVTLAFLCAASVLAGAVAAVVAQDRMPLLPADEQSEAQKQAVATIAARNNGRLPVYLNPFVSNPEVMTRVNALGDYVVRGKTALTLKQSELVILLVVRDWSQRYMWSNHYQAAIRAGLTAETAMAIGEGRRPERLAADEATLYDFCSELLTNRSVSDATYARTVAMFGKSGVLDILGLAGYYTILSMTYNTTRMPPTETGAAIPSLIK